MEPREKVQHGKVIYSEPT